MSSEQYIFNDMRKILINIIKVYMNVPVCGNAEMTSSEIANLQLLVDAK